jgi:hypothetical protein
MEIDEAAMELAAQMEVDLGEVIAPSTWSRKRQAGAAITRSQAKVSFGPR